MPKRPKPKVKGNAEVKADGKATSIARNETQQAQHQVNISNGISPWQKAKAKRRANRQRMGKTHENWFKTQSARGSENKPGVNNTLTESKPVRGGYGKHGVKVSS